MSSPGPKSRLQIYERLREIHQEIHDLMDSPIVESGEDSNALEALNSVLYLAEGVFSFERLDIEQLENFYGIPLLQWNEIRLVLEAGRTSKKQTLLELLKKEKKK